MTTPEKVLKARWPICSQAGAEDRIIPAAHAENVRLELPQSIVEVIPECGHWPQMEKPDLFNPMLISFLGDRPVQTPQQEP